MPSPTLTFTPAMFHASLTGIKDTTRRLITADCFRSADGRIKFIGDEGTLQTAAHLPGQIKPMVTSWRVNGSFDNCKPSALTAADVAFAGGIYWENVGTLHPLTEHFHTTTKTPTCQIHSGRYSHESKLYPARFLPKALYPLAPQVEILTVTAEFLNDITEESALRDGIYESLGLGVGYTWSPKEGRYATAREAYFKLWDSINAQKDGGIYAAIHNPACWTITYRVLPPAPAN